MNPELRNTTVGAPRIVVGRPAFTILLPVHRTPHLLPYAINSVLSQDRSDFELFVISDGAPDSTLACARAFAERDSRIRVFDFPKGLRKGEEHRHAALEFAQGEFVCQIADDDLWMPHHLRSMAELLQVAEFGNTSYVMVSPDGEIAVWPGSLAGPVVRGSMLNSTYNLFGPSVAGYHLSTYRRLEVGWSPAPADLPSDLFMWRKFLRQAGTRLGTLHMASSLAFPASLRRHMTLEDRASEIRRYAKAIAAPDERMKIMEALYRDLCRQLVAAQGVMGRTHA